MTKNDYDPERWQSNFWLFKSLRQQHDRELAETVALGSSRVTNIVRREQC
jgi:hypothetical protein